MDALRPGHAHRSSSDRLLSNYLDAQKALSTSLLTLLSHSHSSTSSLLAYTTSSPGVQIPVRRAVRHAAFEGPLSAHLVENPEAHLDDENPESPGWAAYVSSLDRFRKELKQIHMLEEEMSRVRRDREILVTRLIKSTKSRPKKADLTAMSQEYGQRSPSSMSSRASTLSISSAGSFSTKESKRANKLAEAQAELLGCEEHLRGLEVRIESERNSVMSRGLEERFRAMEAVGRMWVRQARRGLDDLEKIHELPRDAFELDSNGSLAPSQSASQIGYEDSPSHRRGGVPFPRGVPQGSITGSILEEDEGSSDDGNGRNFVVHENRPQATSGNSARGAGGPPKPAPIGVPSVIAPRTGGRRAASDIGYNPSANRRQQPLRRTYSTEQNNERADSDASSVREMGGKQKKKGFFSSIAKMFKGSGSKRDQRDQRRTGRDSPGPVYQSNKGGWSTRTDGNIKRSSSAYGRRGDDSSDDEDQGNLVAVSNNGKSGNYQSFSVDNIGRVGAGGGSIKRSSTMPIASGLIPAKPGNRNSMGAGKRSDSQSTLTAHRATSPDPTGTKTPTQRPASRASTVKSGGAAPSGGVSRSNTLKSASATNITRSNTLKSTASASTAKSGGTGTKPQRTRPNGSISRTALDTQQAAQGRTIMSIVDMDKPPAMPEVPKAPKSHVTPQLELPKAPGSSLLPPASKPLPQSSGNAAPKPISRSNSATPSLGARSNSSKRVSQAPTSPDRSTTPLPPSRLLSPPLKSALRPSSPSPNSSDIKSGSANQAPAPQLYSVSAPGPVQLPAEEKPAPTPAPAPAPESPNAATKEAAPRASKRNSYHSMTTADGESVYESAEDGEGTGGAANEDESSSEEEDVSKYQVYENDRSVEAGRNVGPPAVEKIRSREDDSGDESDDTAMAGAGGQGNDDSSIDLPPRLAKRKSVRMNVPESPAVQAPPPVTDRDGGLDYSTEDRAPSPEPERPDSGAWSSRIGQADLDSEDERDPEYNTARKGLMKNTGKWEGIKSAASPKRKKSVKGSKSGGSVKSR